MTTPNVNTLDLDEMLTRSELTTGILRVVYALQKIEGYKKRDAAQELIKVLDDMGYLQDPLESKGGINNG